MADTRGFVHVPDPDYPGWHTWALEDPALFNGHALGRMLVRPEDDRSARLRLVEPDRQHGNLLGGVHGGVILALIDVALFATQFVVLHGDGLGSVTLDVHSQFIGAGQLGEPVDVVTEVMKETRRLVFLRGVVEQQANLVASFSATIRKPGSR